MLTPTRLSFHFRQSADVTQQQNAFWEAYLLNESLLSKLSPHFTQCSGLIHLSAKHIRTQSNTFLHNDSKLPQQRCPLLNTAIQMCSHLMHNYETSTVWCNSWNCCIENRGHVCDQLPSLKQLWWGSMTLTRRWDAVSLQSLVGSRMRSSWHLHFYIHRINMDRWSRRPALFWFAPLIQWRSWVTGDGWISCHPC